MKILIAPDKFKGSLTAPQASAALRRGLRAAFPSADLEELPIADGGEGTAEVLCAAMHGKWVTAPAHDPLGGQIEAEYAWLPGDVAVITMSAASGLWRVPPDRRNILRASTYGTGELIANAFRRGARQVLLGLGGSATNDGGIGAAAALGYRFMDRNRRRLEPLPVYLPRLANVHRPVHPFAGAIVAMYDVASPLLGSRGATRTFGPQKGGDPQTLSLAEAGLERLAEVVKADLGCDFRDAPGAGAAGGMGFGMASFCGAELCSGFERVAREIGLEAAIAGCDFVVTGEGCLDRQTLEGKGPAGVAALARKYRKLVVAFAGCVVNAGAFDRVFDGVFAIKSEAMPLDVALRDAELLLEQKVREVAAAWLVRAGGVRV